MEEFEEWLNKNRTRLCDDVSGLFNDSLRCYKGNIDRPAYLLAYQGMMLHLRNTIVNGKKPEKFEAREWKQYLLALTDEAKWDLEIYDRVVQKEKKDKGRPAILCMSEEVRNKFSYWRDIRNVCAHYKGYKFIKAHTLTLYSFIVQYLLTITIEGGMRTWLAEFERFCNPALTSPSESVKPSLDKIRQMVQPEEMPEFLNEMLGIISICYFRDSYAILKEMYDRSDLNSYIISFLRQKGHESLCESFITLYPETVLSVFDEKGAIHEFWYNHLPFMYNQVEILAYLLKSGRIPQNDRAEAIKRIMKKMYEGGQYLQIDADIVDILLCYEYFDVFMEHYLDSTFTSRNCKAICYRTNFYISHLLVMNITVELVKRIVSVFTEDYYPYTLCDRIKEEILDAGPAWRKDFESICKRIELEVPDALK